jgi:hypothetical protein
MKSPKSRILTPTTSTQRQSKEKSKKYGLKYPKKGLVVANLMG